MKNINSTYKILLWTFTAAVVMIGYLLYMLNSVQNPSTPPPPASILESGNINLWVIFITGLTVGGLTCLAVQGGLLASVIAVREESTRTNTGKHALISTGAFLVAKLSAYILLGFVLGAFGGILRINSSVQTFMQLAAGIYMVLVALNLLNIHPIFRYVIIQPPRFLTRLVRNQSKSKDFFAPALLGGLTIFIPCGTTIAMEALAISSSNAFMGASVMGAFILGTIPLFFGIGAVTSFLGDTFRSKFLKIAAVIVIYLGITSINGALTAFGSPITIQSIGEKIKLPSSTTITTQNIPEATQTPLILVTSSGYVPNYIRVKKGLPVTLTLKSRDAYSCASAFRIPSLGIERDLAANATQTITFTPTELGKIPFMCSMGMYRGVIEVI
jgi:sulfite exporter TauE/SafE